jgi:hypothetical protein
LTILQSSTAVPNVQVWGKEKLELLKCLTDRRGGITSTVVEGREELERGRERKRARKRM